MDYHGDLTPEDSEWSSQSHVEKAVSEDLVKLVPKEPAESTIRLHVPKFIEEWRRSKADK
jgi:hypothetical protein